MFVYQLLLSLRMQFGYRTFITRRVTDSEYFSCAKNEKLRCEIKTKCDFCAAFPTLGEHTTLLPHSRNNNERSVMKFLPFRILQKDARLSVSLL